MREKNVSREHPASGRTEVMASLQSTNLRLAFSVRETAKLLGVSDKTVRLLISRESPAIAGAALMLDLKKTTKEVPQEMCFEHLETNDRTLSLRATTEFPVPP